MAIRERLGKFLKRISAKLLSLETTGLGGLGRMFGASWSRGTFLRSYAKSLYVHACVSRISQKAASTDLQLYRVKNRKGDVEEVTDSPLLALLWKPNRYQARAEFFEITYINRKLTGNAFWWKVRDDAGNVTELINLRPDWVTVYYGDGPFPGRYVYSPAQGGPALTLAPEDVVHFRYPSPLEDLLGMSPLEPAQGRIDTEQFATDWQRDFFLNSARPDAVLKTTGNLRQDKADEIVAKWEKKHKRRVDSDDTNASRIAILEGGLDYQQVSMGQKEMDFIESSKHTRDEILVVLGMPKSALGITEDVNRANAETGIYLLYSETIVPEVKSFVEKLNEDLVPDFDDAQFIGFRDPTPKNRDAELKEYETGLKPGGWLLVNEVREREDMQPIKGGWTMYRSITDTAVGGLEQAVPAKSKAAEALRAKALQVISQRPGLKAKLAMIDELKAALSAQEPDAELVKALRLKLVRAARVANAKRKAIARIKPKDAPAAKSVKRYLDTPEKRQKWNEFVVKKLDAQTADLQARMTAQARDQEKRVDARLRKLNGKQLKALHAKMRAIIAEGLPDRETRAKVLGVAEIARLVTAEDDRILAEFMLPWLEEYVRTAATDSLGLVAPAQPFNLNSAIIEELTRRAEEFAKGVDETTNQKIADTLAEGLAAGEGTDDLAKRVSEVYDEFGTYRSELIARTETTAASGYGAVEGMRQSGVANAKEWVATIDDRTRPEHLAMDSEVRKLDEAFSNGLQYPQEFNCRCVLVPVFLEE